MNKKAEELLKGNGYRFAIIDVQSILLELQQMDLPASEVILRVDSMLKERLEIREIAGFNLNYEELKMK